MARFAAPGLLVLILVLLAGCDYLRSYVEMVPEKGVSREYRAVLDASTRTRGLHSQLEPRADLTATFKSAEFRAAYVKDYARLYGLTEEQMKTRREVLDEMASDFVEFFLYAAMPDRMRMISTGAGPSGKSIWSTTGGPGSSPWRCGASAK
jgi:hypothetical protein